MVKLEEIYDFVAQRGRPYAHPGHWNALLAENSFFGPPSDSQALLAELQAAFQPDDLLTARIVQKRADGTVELDPVLVDSGAAMIALRKTARSKPFALLSGSKCFAAHQWPISVCLQDYRTVARLSTHTDRETHKDNLLISFSWDDFRILWSLGFPVAPATGLERFDADRTNVFCSLLRLPRRPRDPSLPDFPVSAYPGAGGSSIALTLIGCSVAELSNAASRELPAVQRKLRGMQAMLGLPSSVFKIWLPPMAELDQLRFCGEVGDATDVHDAIVGSIRRHGRQLVPASAQALSGYSQARQDWLSSNGDQGDRDRRQKAWSRVERTQAKELIEPLLVQAQNFSDPLEQNLGIALANTSDLLHRQSLLLLAKCRKPQPQNESSRSLLPQEEFDQWQALQKQFWALMQSLQAVRKGGTPRSRANRQKPSSSSSDAPAKKLPHSNGRDL